MTGETQLLARLEERVKSLFTQSEDILVQVRAIKQHQEDHYVRQEEFRPVEKLVYGLVWFTLVTVLGAIAAVLTQVVKILP